MNIDHSLVRLGRQIAEGNIDMAALAPVIELAEQFGVAPIALGILCDADAPWVVRCRAYDRVAGALRNALRYEPTFTVAA